ncbi:hypothetical protein, partial [Oenococcus oeni]|uniref:hypothetical protein n=2 Tax=Oenococcus oeni TaxID=1247 RepID=UPI000AA54406
EIKAMKEINEIEELREVLKEIKKANHIKGSDLKLRVRDSLNFIGIIDLTVCNLNSNTMAALKEIKDLQIYQVEEDDPMTDYFAGGHISVNTYYEDRTKEQAEEIFLNRKIKSIYFVEDGKIMQEGVPGYPSIISKDIQGLGNYVIYDVVETLKNEVLERA